MRRSSVMTTAAMPPMFVAGFENEWSGREVTDSPGGWVTRLLPNSVSLLQVPPRPPEAPSAAPRTRAYHASLIRASQTWRGIPITNSERSRLDMLREKLDNKFSALRAAPLKQPSRSRVYSIGRT